MANKLRLTVGGVELIINSDDDEQYMQSLAHEINRRISELTNKNSYLSTTMACVIAALEYSDKAKKCNIEIGSLHNQIKKLEEDIANLQLESDEARREIDRINKENQTLRGKLSRQ